MALPAARWLIIGFGAIGREVAVRARAFGAQITAIRRRPQEDPVADRVCPTERLQEVLPEADVVVIACPANASTRGMVDARFLSAMKPDSVLINVARGNLVEEQALQHALDPGTPELAILDVFNQEPPPADSWVWRYPRVVLTPHCSNAGSGTLARTDAVFLENLRRMMAGETLLNVVAELDPS